jgi:Tol biopolymer transport system component
MYQDLGTSFRTAMWGKNKAWVVAVMRREEGEVLVLQSMVQARPPIIVVAGEHIDFDLNPKTGEVVFTVQGFKLPNPAAISKEHLKEANQELVHKHRIGVIDPNAVSVDTILANPRYLGVSDSDKMSFGSPAISPDGSTMLLVEGAYSADTGFEPQRLLGSSISSSGGARPWQIVEGQVGDPSWSPDGDKIVYTRRVGGERAICTNTSHGGDEKVLTAGKGSFSHPTFSPQTKSE